MKCFAEFASSGLNFNPIENTTFGTGRNISLIVKRDTRTLVYYFCGVYFY